MSRFNFLGKQFPELRESVEKAEETMIQNPEVSVLMARKSLEQLTKWLCIQKANISIKNKSLHNLLSDKNFQKNVPSDILNRMFSIKKTGNSVAHEHIKVESKVSTELIDDLFFIFKWFISEFSDLEKQQEVERQHDEQIIAKSAVKAQPWKKLAQTEQDAKEHHAQTKLKVKEALAQASQESERRKAQEKKEAIKLETLNQAKAETWEKDVPKKVLATPDWIPKELRDQAAIEAKREREERADILKNQALIKKNSVKVSSVKATDGLSDSDWVAGIIKKIKAEKNSQ